MFRNKNNSEQQYVF